MATATPGFVFRLVMPTPARAQTPLMAKATPSASKNGLMNSSELLPSRNFLAQ